MVLNWASNMSAADWLLQTHVKNLRKFSRMETRLIFSKKVEIPLKHSTLYNKNNHSTLVGTQTKKKFWFKVLKLVVWTWAITIESKKWLSRPIWFYSPIGNVWLCNPQHVDCGLVELDEDTIMDLKKAQQLENLSHLRTHAIDTWSKKSD